MAWILGTPKFQAIYNDAAVSGGTLYFYEPGTTTGKSAYPTLADAAAGTNGFTSKLLDAQGQPTSTDLFAMNGSYKLVLKDSSAATLWTVDNVEGQDDLIDVNGNELIKFTATASAVNEITVANAATGSGPIISVTGGDSDVDLNFQAKGAGEYNFKSTSSQSAEIRLFEDTDNGTNYIGIKPPAALTASTTFTYPDGDGTSGQVMKTDASGTLSWVSPGMEYISTQAASSSATIDFTGLTANYWAYKVILENVRPATDAQDLVFTLSTDNGSNFLASAYNTTVVSHNGTSTVQATSAAASAIQLSESTGNNATPGESVAGELLVINPMNSATMTRAVGNLSSLTAASVYECVVAGGHHTTAAAHNAIRFAFSSGNIAVGQFTLYGIRKVT